MLPSANKVYKGADLLFQQDIVPAHTTKCHAALMQQFVVRELQQSIDSINELTF